MIEIVVQAPKRPQVKRKPPKRVKIPLKPKKPVKKAKKKVWKFVKTELSECDSAFSKEIIERDGHCLFPGCSVQTNLTNSHYIGRGNWNTRFDPENCITLCIRHHFMDRDTAFEFQKARAEKHGWDGQYTIFQRKLLGEIRFRGLLERATWNKSRKDAILETQKRYNLRQPTLEHEPQP